jgi:triphosphatase
MCFKMMPCAKEEFLMDGHEIEVKFMTNAEGLRRAAALPLLGFAAEAPWLNLHSIYFDTPANDLRNSGIILRLRKKVGNGAVLCVKYAGSALDGPFRRGEIEVPSPNLQPDIALFDKATASELNKIVGAMPLKAQFETRVKRRSKIVTQGDCRIEVALDDGHIVAGDTRLPLKEIELELKAGEEAGLYHFALKLVDALPLQLDFMSKSERGFRACDQQVAHSVTAKFFTLREAATLDEAVSAVVSSTLGHFVANWAALRASDHPEAVHQMRVSLRRMQCGIAIFKRILPPTEFEVFRSEAKRIASALAPAREADVFREKAEQGPLADAACPAGRAALLKAVENRWIAAYKAARAVLADPATSGFVLKVQLFLVRGAIGLSDVSLHPIPAQKFARKALSKLYSRVLKRGNGLPDISDEARHKLRIALKNLRYGVEFFGGLFVKRSNVKAYVSVISELQDLLGAHNDEVTARHFLAELNGLRNVDQREASGFVLGWYARGIACSDAELLKCWKMFKKIKPFWD